ncbi:MAG: ABC transporter ATP-binding protein [Arthrospira sp. PLM2.Bin9]|nr:ABC transporter ATP-binding protein [Arthrospira sp. PLM2.Bin9]TVU53071.1 MAG: ABC transporter ATP-binding protein [Arthrospira sp. PLM2.Bin9]
MVAKTHPSKPETDTLLRVENLQVHFPVSGGIFRQKQVGIIRAVDGLTFEIKRGETLSLVGESGCGKSTTGRAILQLQTPTGGRVYFNDIDLTKLDAQRLRIMRRQMQIIFQDPYASLNPRMTLKKIIGEPLLIHRLAKGESLINRVQELLELVGLNPQFINRYPHEFSGGQRQRIAIARALAVDPDFLVCDEPIASLDVSIQAQVVNLMRSLQKRLNLTYLFIAHDLSIVRYISSRVAVMYLGKIVEIGECNSVYDYPLHPYTKALLSAVPIPDPEIEAKRERIILKGDVPSFLLPSSGCRFYSRCPSANLVGDRCRVEEPQLREINPGHFVSCHLWDSQNPL